MSKIGHSDFLNPFFVDNGIFLPLAYSLLIRSKIIMFPIVASAKAISTPAKPGNDILIKGTAIRKNENNMVNITRVKQANNPSSLYLMSNNNITKNATTPSATELNSKASFPSEAETTEISDRERFAEYEPLVIFIKYSDADEDVVIDPPEIKAVVVSSIKFSDVSEMALSSPTKA